MKKLSGGLNVIEYDLGMVEIKDVDEYYLDIRGDENRTDLYELLPRNKKGKLLFIVDMNEPETITSTEDGFIPGED